MFMVEGSKNYVYIEITCSKKGSKNMVKEVKQYLDIQNSRSAVGQFTISLTKVCGSLGFTLRQLDDTVLKHTIKVALSL